MQGIVLSRRDWREHDQLISFYTKEKGKVELLARGVKKIISKNAASLEPFSYVLIDSVQGREINLLTTVVPIEFFSSIRHDLEKSLGAGAIMDILNHLLDVGQRDARLWQSLLSWLRFVEESKNFTPLLIDGLIVVVAEYLGWGAVLEKCVICGKSFRDLISEEFKHNNTVMMRPGFYFAGGGLICTDCRRKKQSIGELIIDSGLKEISDLQLLRTGDWRRIAAFPFSYHEQIHLHRLVYQFLVYHSERELSDWYGLMMPLEQKIA